MRPRKNIRKKFSTKIREVFMKKSVLKRIMPVLLISSLAISMVACGTSSETDEASASAVTTIESATTTAATAETVDPLGKYEPGITITTANIANPNDVFPEGDSWDENVWTRYYQEKLGITVKRSWLSPDDQYKSKLTASIASGDIPDVLKVDEATFKMCLESDLLQDIGPAFDKYASEGMKNEVYGGNDGLDNLAYGKVNGKLMGLAAPMSTAAESGPILYVRKDWLDKLQLPEPKTISDIETISEAFTKKDPDGNGKNDTFGFGVAKDFVHSAFPGGIGDALGIYNGYHAYPGIWVEDGKGELEYGSIQSQMKPALAKLNEMYKAGLIDKEFGVKDRWKVGEDVAAGKIGLFFGTSWTPVVPCFNNYKNDKNAVWMSYPVVSADSSPALASGYRWMSGFYVVSKKCKNPEAVIKMGNLSYETSYGSIGKSASDFKKEISDKYIISADQKYSFFKYMVVDMYRGDKNIRESMARNSAVIAKDPSKLPANLVSGFDEIMKWINGDRAPELFNSYHLNESYKVISDYYFDKGQCYPNKFSSIQTPAMLEKMKTLDDLASQVYTKIIMQGNVDSEFDKFVVDWKKLGGDQITKEANDWYSTTK